MTLRIAEVAERTGVPATTLRYYEEIGLLTPAERSPNGYRAYTERDVERLRFVIRARRLHISLDELRELVIAWDGADCAQVQDRMACVVSARLALTKQRVAELADLAAQLQAAAGRLAGATATGRCDGGCPCSTLPVDVATPSPIRCTLDAGALQERVGQWQAVLARALDRDLVEGGVTVTFPHDPDLAGELARLATAEHGCCPFLDVTLEVSGAGVRLRVRGPVEAQDLITAVLAPSGAAAGS